MLAGERVDVEEVGVDSLFAERRVLEVRDVALARVLGRLLLDGLAGQARSERCERARDGGPVVGNSFMSVRLPMTKKAYAISLGGVRGV